MIRVIYRTGEEDRVSPKFLDILLYLNQIQMFERDSGWIVVDVDPLRTADSNQHAGSDRRRHQQTPLPAPLRTTPWDHTRRRFT